MSRRLLLTRDDENEPWLDNPLLVVANPRSKKKGGRMARPKKRRKLPDFSRIFGRKPHKKGKKRTMRKARKSGGFFAKRRRASRRVTRRRSAPKSRGRIAVFKMNRPKRHNHFRRNRAVARAAGGGISLPFGLKMPAIKDVAFGAIGLFVPGMLTSAIMNYVPASFAGSKVVTWLVKVAAVLVPGALLAKYVDVRAGYAYMIGGAASLLVDAIRTFVPSVASMVGLGFQPLLGYYPGGAIAGSSPGMGDYSVNGNVKKFAQAQRVTPVLMGVPDRLNPTGRF